MNSTTSDLLASLGIDSSALEGPIAFHKYRHPAAYEQGLWGVGAACPGLPAIFAADYENPDCPEGWDTFWGFLAKTEPEVLALMDQMPEASEADERELAVLCEREGVVPRVVSASSWLVRQGVFEAMAYPVHLLKAHAAAGGVL